PARRPPGRSLGDLAALRLAVLLGRLDPALALAGVLTRARVVGAVAGALALARVHALTLHLVRVSRPGHERGRRAEEAGRHGGDECAFRRHIRPSFPVDRCIGSGSASVCRAPSSSKPGQCLLPALRSIAIFPSAMPESRSTPPENDNEVEEVDESSDE